MHTQVSRVTATAPEAEVIAQAAAVLRRGGLVAFPTETVYGLGANALDPRAVAGIFIAKGRPSTNPLIVHVADPVQAGQVAAAWPELAARLAERFWPCPLTLVLPRREPCAVSLLASAWMSITAAWMLPLAPKQCFCNSACTARKGSSSASMKSRPMTLTTSALRPPLTSTTAAPRPGVPGG